MNDRRMISGVLHVLGPRGRRRDGPPEDGSATTIHDRINHQGRRHTVRAVAATGEAPDELAATPRPSKSAARKPV